MQQLHELKPVHKNKKGKRIGRGGKRGTYSGKGIKGQKARAGRKLKPVIRDLIKRYPKLRGYKFNPKIKSRELRVIVNLGVLEKNFKENETVSPSVLIKKGIISTIKGKIPEVKVLGKGEITKPLIIKGCELSNSAKEKIEKVKGKIH